MPTIIHLGSMHSNNISQAGSINFGANVVQNRNAAKFNIGNFVVFEGTALINTNKNINFDPDYLDSSSFDGNNYVGNIF